MRTKTGAVNWVESKETGAVNWVESKETGAVNLLESAATATVDGMERIGRAAVTAVETAIKLGLGALALAGKGALALFEGAWHGLQAAWGWLGDKLGKAWDWVKDKVGKLAGWINDHIIQPSWNWLQQQWADFKAWFARTFPGLTKCWEVFKEYAGAAGAYLFQKLAQYAAWFRGLPLWFQLLIFPVVPLGSWMVLMDLWGAVPGPVQIAIHLLLGVLTFIPEFGAIPAAIDSLLYLLEGDYLNATLAALVALAALVPGLGDAAEAARATEQLAIAVGGAENLALLVRELGTVEKVGELIVAVGGARNMLALIEGAGGITKFVQLIKLAGGVGKLLELVKAAGGGTKFVALLKATGGIEKLLKLSSAAGGIPKLLELVRTIGGFERLEEVIQKAGGIDKLAELLRAPDGIAALELRLELKGLGIDEALLKAADKATLDKLKLALDQWNVGADGTNQGITHIIDYAGGAGGAGKANRLQKLEEYLGIGPFDASDPNVIAQVTEALDQQVAKAAANGTQRTVGNKVISFVAKDGKLPPFSNSQKGIVIIKFDGKYSTFFNTTYKAFLNLS